MGTTHFWGWILSVLLAWPGEAENFVSFVLCSHTQDLCALGFDKHLDQHRKWMLKSEWLSLPRHQNIEDTQYNQCLLPSGGALTTYSLNIQREKIGHKRPSHHPQRGDSVPTPRYPPSLRMSECRKNPPKEGEKGQCRPWPSTSIS